MLLVDSHCHLDMLEKEQTIEQLLAKAKQNKVEYVQTICTKLDDIENILDIATKYPQIFASVGVHPSEVSQEGKIVSYQELKKWSEHRKIIAFGETGLDFYYNKNEIQQKKQISSFEQHLIVAQQEQLPVIIHMRAAEDATHHLVREKMQEKTFPGLIHCFTASEKFANQMLDLGLYISISGIVTFKNAADLQKIVKYLPLDRLLVETDAPYLAPVPHRGKVNEPAYTYQVAAYIAELKNISLEKLAQATTDNFFRLFSKASR